MTNEQIPLLHVERRQTNPPDLAEQFRRLIQFAVDNKLDDVTKLLRGLRDGRYIMAPNATLREGDMRSFRVDL